MTIGCIGTELAIYHVGEQWEAFPGCWHVRVLAFRHSGYTARTNSWGVENLCPPLICSSISSR